MAIVKNPKVNGVYFAYDNDLKIANNSPTSGHTIIVTSINKKRKTARVKTITTLGEYSKKKKKWIYNFDKIDEVRKGNILAIPYKKLKAKNFSGVHHNSRTIKLNQIYHKIEITQLYFLQDIQS